MNIRLVISPFFLCLFLVLIQSLVNKELDKSSNRCGCTCVDTDGDGQCEKKCGIEYSTLDQVGTCPISQPPEWPPVLQIPAQRYRAVRTDFISDSDLPDESCKATGSCPVTMLVTGYNQTLGLSVASNMFARGSLNINSSDILFSLADYPLGSESKTQFSSFLEPAFFSNLPVYYVQSQCDPNSEFPVSLQIGFVAFQQDVSCVPGLQLWRNSSSEINDELYKGYRKGNKERKINEILAAYDFLNSNANNFNPLGLTRVPRSINLISNACLNFLLGPSVQMPFEFVKEMPKPETKLRLDFSSQLGPLFLSLVIFQLFPVVLTSLVYEKQQKLRIMMKMHGLGDWPYWMISYAYFLLISSIYMLCLVIFGSLIGLKFFTLNDYSIQFVFYFIYVNLQVSAAFLVADLFCNVKTTAVVGYMMVFCSGLLGGFLFQFFLQDTSFPRVGIVFMELYPGFSLYRGLYEFAEYSYNGNHMGTDGMRWKDLNDSKNGMREVLIIMLVQWLVVIGVAYYANQVASSGRSPLFFFWKHQNKCSKFFRKPSCQKEGSKFFVEMEKLDVVQEREKVEQLLLESSTSHAIICDDLKKLYPGRDGNPEKFAVRGLSLALPQGECFGMLGPTGAGKTSFINMISGLIKPSSGAAYVHGLDIRMDMDRIYTSMGICPQHDLLWETLTGREHLLFFGRLKNLKGAALNQAVEESLRNVNLFHGVADKQAGKYSGGMKRRLSVAISLIGDPKVRGNTRTFSSAHSMEEAEHLCDRLGIFMDGSLQCVGNPKELKARYGGSYVFTITTSSNNDEEVENLVRRLSPNANKIYQISGTQKFELPKQEIIISRVFKAIENAKSRFTIHAWGLDDTTLEDVFMKVTRGA
ncbi:ABC transporter A family member 7-like [Olea europaea subsp. europaea]|uniref:ABC transporter A family member 7-like n=1 Tax=Olea europaea subsp. europaea TaxID=158383 RepID=A0A8S0VLB3_OLEEU|nr:ABC transporter A family member 7-like [Olea europaea subsp. europaea]